MAENAAKRLKTSEGSGVRIGTHNGHFHADEALAVYMLRLLPTYANSSLVRTRDPALLETCHTVVDVGGEYDATRNRYDHHQRTFTTTFPGRATKLSSAGLVYMHFGRAIIAQQMQKAEDSAEVSVLWNKIYESFIEALDAHDNGISSYDPVKVAEAGLEKRFSTGAFTLGAMVGRLNPNWNDPRPADKVEAQAAEDARFVMASQRIGEEFSRDLQFYTSAWLPARTIVQEAYSKRMQYDPEGRIMVFEGQSVPWKDHLYTLEEEDGTDKKVLYVLYPESPTPGAVWRIQAVPETESSFQSRKALPEPWRGARDAQLDEVSGIPGGIFVHAAGFIGGNKTFDGAKALADKACAF
ncbi:metal-dependent protein hydrolase [Annulohypoxylon maeteangense]|uniref:metal-dependent protein hydrolase n=1 Tax=Annulohypoxylon maeteangense TaxID=1927788 RepID=UPI0020080812|nr:metal-dependent protein hydrolase [Annulohypoxylon maeteangense]KAI0881744.1 metal-dependent protein hydrolase [Annulohypoxylon maeteangense]